MLTFSSKIASASHAIGAWWQFSESLLLVAKKRTAGLATYQALKGTVRFCINGIMHRAELTRLRETFDCEELSGVLELFPAIEEKLFIPYVNDDWTLEQRLEKLKDHFELVKEIFGAQAKEIYKSQGLALFEFSTADDIPFTIELFPGYQNEGAIGLRLRDAHDREVYAMSIHLGSEPCRTMYIGALQGPNDRIPDRQKEIVKLTRSNYGLRPKALMVEAMYILAKRLRVEKIYGISNSKRIYPSSFIGGQDRSKLLFDADALWQEYHAVLQDSGFYEFPLEPIRKTMDQLKSNKRALYRRRYAWLEKAAIYSNESLDSLIKDVVEEESWVVFDRAA